LRTLHRRSFSEIALAVTESYVLFLSKPQTERDRREACFRCHSRHNISVANTLQKSTIQRLHVQNDARPAVDRWPQERKTSTEPQLKQIAHPQLSLERVNRKILDDRDAELRGNHGALGRLPADHEVERQKQSARLIPDRRPIVQSNVRAGVERKEQVVRQIDVEGRRDAQLPQHPAVVIAFEIDSVT